MNRIAKTLIILGLMGLAAMPAVALDDGWPRTLALDEGIVTLYAPQIEAIDGDTLYFRAALAYRPDITAEPIFGAGWLKSRVDIDEEQDRVSPSRLELTQTRFPEGTTDIEAELATALLLQSVDWNLDFTVQELNAALEAAEAETLAAQKLKTAPPKIIYRDGPALLVLIDGKPIEREIEDSPYRAVVNTTWPLITDGDDYFLNTARGVWYRADAATGPYRLDRKPPKDVVQMVEAAQEAGDDESAPTEPAEPITADNAPEIVVSTQPAELLVTEGPADFVPLVGDLLVLQNSADDVFMHVGEQQYYIVLAGRWYRADSLEGPWAYQPSDALPDDFAQIPDESPQADTRVHVAGTPEAEEAVLDAHVPQTAKVERGQVDIDVEYDGDPEFERVDGTDDLYYAENTGATVLESDRTYYLLEDGVWYVSTSPHGPWVVSDHRPGEIDSIEPSSPVYNTKYVYVYDATPEVVYVGYTPGYYGSYVHRHTIVYGTGWYYRPWVSPHYYYPRHSTWGFHVGYSNYGGWSFGLSWNWGPWWDYGWYTGGYWHYGRPWHHRHWGYWGPVGYYNRPYYRHGYAHHRYGPYGKRHHGYRDRYAHNEYGNDHGRRGHRDGYRDGSRDHQRDQNRDWDRDHGRNGRRNLYRDDRQQARVRDTRDVWNNDPDFRNDPGPGAGRRGETRFVDNRKVRASKAGPVKRSDLVAKAQVREVNRAAEREPMIVNNHGEVYRADFNNSGPRVRENSSRDAGATARRDEGAARSRERGNDLRRAVSQPREIERRAPASKPERRRVEPRPGQPTRSQPREVERRAPESRPERRVASQPRQVERRRARPGPPKASSAPRRREPAPVVHQPRREPAPVARQQRREPAPVVRQPRREPAPVVRQPRREPAPVPRQQRVEPSRQVNRTPSRPAPSVSQASPQRTAPPRREAPSASRPAPQRSAPPRREAPQARNMPRPAEQAVNPGRRDGGQSRGSNRDRRKRN